MEFAGSPWFLPIAGLVAGLDFVEERDTKPLRTNESREVTQGIAFYASGQVPWQTDSGNPGPRIRCTSIAAPITSRANRSASLSPHPSSHQPALLSLSQIDL